MAEVNAKDLTTKTSPASTDSMLLFGTTSNEGAKITVDNLADNILGRLTTKTFANQVGGSSAATLLAQLSTLNSNITPSQKYSYTDERFSGDITWITIGKICFVVILGNVLKTAPGDFTIVLGNNFPICAGTGFVFDTIVPGNPTAGGLRVQPSASAHSIYFYKYGNTNPLGVRVSFCFPTA